MYTNLGFVESYMHERVDELLRDAERERMIALASGPRRSVRGRVADVLFACAEWIDGAPRGTMASASASAEV